MCPCSSYFNLCFTLIDRYNTLTDQWEVYAYWHNATSDGGAFGVNNTLFLVGGYDHDYNTQSTVTAFDTVKKSFSYKSSMHHDRGDIAVASLPGIFLPKVS